LRSCTIADNSSVSGDYKFSKRIRAIIKKQGVNFFKKKCINLVAWNLDDDRTDGSASTKAADAMSGKESREASSTSCELDVSSESSTEESESKHRPVKFHSKKEKKTSDIKKGRDKERRVSRYIIYRTVDGERKLIFFKLGKDLNVKMKWDHEDPNQDINKNPERRVIGFDYQSPPSLPADEELELEPFPEYVEPDPAELGLIAEDVLEFGATSMSASTSGSDSSPLLSGTEDESSSSEEIVNFQPLSKKPRFEFSPSSTLTSKLPDFLASMKAANDNLQADIVAGKKEHLLEIDGATEKEGEQERSYIEMDLGLGVLEETANHSDSADDDSNKSSAEADFTADAATGKSSTKKSVFIEEL
jgi:hypothetical protein